MCVLSHRTLSGFPVSSAEVDKRRTQLLRGFDELYVRDSESQRGPCKNCELCLFFSPGGLQPLQCLEAFCW